MIKFFINQFSNIRIKKDCKRIVCVLFFDRPQYLKLLIESLERNSDEDTDYLFFQDGVIDRNNNDQIVGDLEAHYKSTCIVDNSRLKNKILFITENNSNLGVAVMQREILRIVFDNSDIDFAFFLEDDFILSDNYFKIIESIADKYKNTNRVFSIQGYSGNILSDLEISKYYNHVCVTDAHQWGIAIWKKRWDLIKDNFDIYYEFMKNKSYHLMRAGIYKDEIEKIYNTINQSFISFDSCAIPPSQDGCKSLCIRTAGMFQLTTKVNYLKPIGEEGLNFRSKIFKKYKLDEIKIAEYDLSDYYIFDEDSMVIFDEFFKRKSR